MDTEKLIGKVITRSHAVEKLLRKHYPAAANGGLHPALNSLADTLPAILVRVIRVVAVIRNAAAHPDGFKSDTVPSDFDRLCEEIEHLIPYFAARQNAKPASPPKEPKPPAAKPPPPVAVSAKPQSGGVPASLPANHGKPWTDEEEKKLLDAYDAQTATIPELAEAHQRGIGGIQNKLIKRGRLTADQYQTYPPDSPLPTNSAATSSPNLKS